MDFDNLLPKEASRIPRKPERPYNSSLKSSPMETRRRPLRTYSKRTLSTESTEPAPKRQCLTKSPAASIQDEEIHLNPTEPEHSAAVSESDTSPTLPPIQKGTITAYFSRKTQPPVAILSSDPLVDLFPDTNTTTISPPSPPNTPARRSARRLKTRVATRRIDENNDSDKEQETRDDKNQVGRIRGIDPPLEAHPPALSEATPNTLNLKKVTSSTRPEGDKSQGNKRREAKAPLVQTTLSLSMSEAHYTECKECGMLYNHLHETDVKYHARRHAALRRAKMRTDARRDDIE